MDASGSDELAWSPEDELVRRELVEMVRTLMPASMLTEADDDAMTEALALVTQATTILTRSSRTSRYERRPGLTAGIGANDPVWETHAAFGRSNPLAPPVVVEEEPGRVMGTVTFGDAYEGGPGTVYGGFVAAAFDGMLGRTVLSAGYLGVTRSLAVRYLRPTPLRVPLRIIAQIGAVSGRNVEVSAQMRDGDRVTCEADAVFTTVDPTRYEM
jgi:acyl-coenzyme A thioesterase PaaI-like protein